MKKCCTDQRGCTIVFLGFLVLLLKLQERAKMHLCALVSYDLGACDSELVFEEATLPLLPLQGYFSSSMQCSSADYSRRDVQQIP